MALVAVEVVLEKLATLLTDEVQLLGGVRRGVGELRDDLESMRAFLQDAESQSEIDKGIGTWVKQVRAVAYETEDVLDEFVIRLSPPPHDNGPGVFHLFRKSYHYIRHLRTRHHLAVQVEDIKSKIKAIARRRNAFSLKKTEEAATSSSALTLQTWHDPRLSALFLEEADVLGIESPKRQLISWLITGDKDLTTVSVVGMGGVGKTTLVKQAYDSQAVKKHFDCHAWITVSKSFTAADLLRAALKDLLEKTKEPIPEGIDATGELQLVNKLRDYLREKRYVVVFDDVWNVNAWEVVKFALPDCCCGSRVIFTTRIGDVAASIDTIGHVYNLQPLLEEEAWKLFCMKAFRGENKGVCPKELEGMSRSMLRKCGGLPLAIVAIGSLLSKKNQHGLEWKKVHDTLSSEMKGNSSLERILLLSYHDLPYHLKCCFLYLSVFPEDYLIKRTKIIRLWVTERFVEENPGLTREEVAEKYLNQLVSRSMIQVVEMDYCSRAKAFRVHDVMREIIELKSRDESFVTILNHKGIPIDEKVRRMAIHDSCEELSSDTRFASLRSLLVFAPIGSPMSSGKAFFMGFRLLGLLELELAPLYEFPPQLAKLIHLRYLSLRRTMIREIPQSIGKLKNLEILDIKHCRITSLPDGILKLNRLCQLRGYRYDFDASMMFPRTRGVSLPLGIGGMTTLEKLGIVEVNGNGDMVRELGKLTQLRRLGILELTRENGMDLCSTLEKLKHLTALYVVSISTTEPLLHLDSLSSPPRFLQRLHLKSSLPTLPKWITSLEYLAKLVLQYSNLDDDPLKALQGLPNLVELILRVAYAGEELCCSVGGYPRLKRLGLQQLRQLKCITVEKGAMPELRRLDIASCHVLELVPVGIEHLRNLQDLYVWDMPHGFYQKIERPHGEDFWRVEHITTIEDMAYAMSLG